MQLRRTRSKVSADSSNNGTTFIPPTQAELYELISARAYELYLQRATAPGDAFTDWLKAEVEVLATTDTLPVDIPSPPVRGKVVVSQGGTSGAARVRSRSKTSKARVPKST
jgi:hypothetical protein